MIDKNYVLEPIEIWTDGSSRDVFFGGWAYQVFIENNLYRYDSGYAFNVSNQKMELYAAIVGLEWIKDFKKENQKVILYSDSAYLINCKMKEWWKTWQKNGWKNSNKKEVANIEYWTRLLPFFKNQDYEFKHVRGHYGIINNESCDALAQKESEKAIRQWEKSNAEQKQLLSGQRLV